MAVNENGKYTKLTEDTVHKLEEAFSLDSSVEEACFYANISKQTFYNWINDNEKMKERFDALRQKPVLLARQTVVKKISESYSNAMDYLSRKKKLEFGLKSEVVNIHEGEVKIGHAFNIDNIEKFKNIKDEYEKKLAEEIKKD